MFKTKYSAKQIFEELPVGKALAIQALPAIAGQLVSLIYNMADTFFVGRVNNPLMITATSLVYPVFCLCVPLYIIAGVGGGTLVSRLMGVNRYDEAKKVATFSAYLCLAIGIVYSLGVYIFMDPLLKLLGTSAEAYEFTRQYMTCVVVLGAIPTMLSGLFSTLLRNVGESKSAGFGISMGGILNIILDPIFMFVLLPDGQEVIGAGIATMLSNLAATIYFMIKVISFSKTKPVGLSPKVGLPEKRHIAEIFKVGLPAATTTLLFDINNMLLNKLMSAYGDIAVAAIGMTLKIERLSLNICVGLCLGMCPLVAYNYSAGNINRMQSFIKTTRRTGTIVSIISIVMYEIFATVLIRFFIMDAETVVLGAAFLRRRAVASVFMFLSFYIPHVCQGIGDGRMNLLFSTMRYLIFCIPALFICDALWGMYGLAWAQAVGDILNAAVSALIYVKMMNKNLGDRKQ